MGYLYEILACFCIIFVVVSYDRTPDILRMGTFLIGSTVFVLIWIPIMIFTPRNYRNALGPATCCRDLCWLLGFTMEVRGLENLITKSGAVVVMNQQSVLDLCVLAHLWPVIGQATVVAKRKMLFIPIFGFGAWLWGTMFTNLSQIPDSIEMVQKESKAINEGKCKLLLFPEGTRNSEETLLPFKEGAFHIAVHSQCPIQPVVISKFEFLDSKTKIFTPGHAIIHIMPPIHTKGYNMDDLDRIIKQTRYVMQAEFTKLSQEAKDINSKDRSHLFK
ncbi:1-acyl-sn-glycerol-3-phosphate acyltransferase alpha-like [Teleopsis dalmanni]|uniref:1-acyl-sn-glycerol-3-phosphate acyltransferase alpha-like n=1 Tax=Teleopsis dalmanni TaxID=139649 RepID=UPI000D32B4EF|nr:1-acyl-sn-glycerol-3-phosphate acyltransferase alpha-like [Teleopsis dalmanni]XP_037960338.1 1-acyl-sn-glycerol-3-phosphate acyltransferase alpha-like [Teleopsis dalmanni]XP_037960339.1 1-acyl-sn-glycerol-3-phosphate acyltransferase alpha-like [Teleopsis dalmanni]